MLSLLLSLFAWCAVAFGGEQRLVYDLRVDGSSVGKRELTIRYLSTSAGEVRILETWTELELTVAGTKHSFKSRGSAKAGGTPGFSASIQEDGQLREVQGRQLPDRRWMVVIAEDGQVKTWYYRPSEVALTSLDLLDPRRHLLLLDQATAGVLAAETGTVLAGAVQDLGEGSVKVGGTEVPVRRASWAPETGPMLLAWSEDGLLVSYETAILGRRVTATLTEMPAPATFGTVETPALQTGSTLSEEPL